MKDFKEGLRLLGITAAVLLFAAVFVIELASVVPFSYAGEYNTIYTSTIVATVTVPLYCGISLSPNAIDFGVISPGEASGPSTAVIDTNSAGNIDASLWISAGNWIGTNGLIQALNFGPSNTFDSPTSFVGVSPANALGFSPAYTGLAISGGSSGYLYFGVQIPPGQAANVYTQDITIENSC